MEIRVDVVKELEKMRTNYYTSPYTWIDEVVQNAQRSSATEFSLRMDYDRIVIHDNGPGCDDPEAIFTKNVNGWDEDVIEADTPFGEGFFSLLTVGSHVTVRSQDWKVVIDFDHMIASGDLSYNIQPMKKYHKGFTVVVRDITDDFRFSDSLRYAEELLAWIPIDRIYINKDLVQHMKIEEPNEDVSSDDEYSTNPFLILIDDEDMKGFIVPSVDCNFYSKVLGFVQSRPVSSIENVYAADGRIHINNHTITLRCPDRKAFVDNADYYNLKCSLRTYIKQAYKQIVASNDADLITEYSRGISNYLERADYLPLLTFKLLHKESLDDIINRLSQQDRKAVGSDTIEELTSKDKEVTFDKLPKYGFYVDTDEMYKYSEELALAEYHSLPVVLIRNELENSIISDMDNWMNIYQVASNTHTLTDVEDAIIHTQYTELARNLIPGLEDVTVFTAHLNAVLQIKIPYTGETFDKEVAIGGVHKSVVDEVYLDRDYMANNSLGHNLTTLAHELAHNFGFQDNTTGHQQMQSTILCKIIDKLAENKGVI